MRPGVGAQDGVILGHRLVQVALFLQALGGHPELQWLAAEVCIPIDKLAKGRCLAGRRAPAEPGDQATDGLAGRLHVAVMADIEPGKAEEGLGRAGVLGVLEHEAFELEDGEAVVAVLVQGVREGELRVGGLRPGCGRGHPQRQPEGSHHRHLLTSLLATQARTAHASDTPPGTVSPRVGRLTRTGANLD